MARQSPNPLGAVDLPETPGTPAGTQQYPGFSQYGPYDQWFSNYFSAYPYMPGNVNDPFYTHQFSGVPGGAPSPTPQPTPSPTTSPTPSPSPVPQWGEPTPIPGNSFPTDAFPVVQTPTYTGAPNESWSPAAAAPYPSDNYNPSLLPGGADISPYMQFTPWGAADPNFNPYSPGTPSFDQPGEQPQQPPPFVQGQDPNEFLTGQPGFDPMQWAMNTPAEAQPALADWSQAVSQYGYGGFSYDANGDIVPNGTGSAPATPGGGEQPLIPEGAQPLATYNRPGFFGYDPQGNPITVDQSRGPAPGGGGQYGTPAKAMRPPPGWSPSGWSSYTSAGGGFAGSLAAGGGDGSGGVASHSEGGDISLGSEGGGVPGFTKTGMATGERGPDKQDIYDLTGKEPPTIDFAAANQGGNELLGHAWYHNIFRSAWDQGGHVRGLAGQNMGGSRMGGNARGYWAPVYGTPGVTDTSAYKKFRPAKA